MMSTGLESTLRRHLMQTRCPNRSKRTSTPILLIAWTSAVICACVRDALQQQRRSSVSFASVVQLHLSYRHGPVALFHPLFNRLCGRAIALFFLVVFWGGGLRVNWSHIKK